MPIGTKSSLSYALGILIPCNNVRAYHAAGHLVAAQVVRENPIELSDDEEPLEGDVA